MKERVREICNVFYKEFLQFESKIQFKSTSFQAEIIIIVKKKKVNILAKENNL